MQQNTRNNTLVETAQATRSQADVIVRFVVIVPFNDLTRVESCEYAFRIADAPFTNSVVEPFSFSITGIRVGQVPEPYFGTSLWIGFVSMYAIRRNRHVRNRLLHRRRHMNDWETTVVTATGFLAR